MLVGRNAQQLAGRVLIVDGRWHAPDAELPCDQHHVFCRQTEIEHDRQRHLCSSRVGRHERDGDGSSSDMAGPWAQLG